ncbi:hypothetical protein AB0G73_28330 [Streptomyces sp. NPDC020719]|uniref:hypothetical protein n=1 Tax=Streptomyces sp. NPDC020719 TaxID=3154896 RepID=UPI0033D96B89
MERGEAETDVDGIDFAGAQATREAMRADLAGRIAPDVAAALQRPGTPDWLLARPPQLVARLGDLAGPAGGAVQVPASWGMPPGPHSVADLYQRALLYGTAQEQARMLHAGQLVTVWEQLRDMLPDAVVFVWQERFPELGR